MNPAAPRLSHTASPVHWLKGEVMLRSYLAQRDHFLELHDRAMSEFYQHGPAAKGGDREERAVATS